MDCSNIYTNLEVGSGGDSASRGVPDLEASLININNKLVYYKSLSDSNWRKNENKWACFE